MTPGVTPKVGLTLFSWLPLAVCFPETLPPPSDPYLAGIRAEFGGEVELGRAILIASVYRKHCQQANLDGITASGIAGDPAPIRREDLRAEAQLYSVRFLGAAQRVARMTVDGQRLPPSYWRAWIPFAILGQWDADGARRRATRRATFTAWVDLEMATERPPDRWPPVYDDPSGYVEEIIRLVRAQPAKPQPQPVQPPDPTGLRRHRGYYFAAGDCPETDPARDLIALAHWALWPGPQLQGMRPGIPEDADPVALEAITRWVSAGPTSPTGLREALGRLGCAVLCLR